MSIDEHLSDLIRMAVKAAVRDALSQHAQQAPGDHGPLLVRLRDVAALSSVSISEAKLWAACDRIPGRTELGARCVRFRADMVRAWILAGCQAAEKWRPSTDQNGGPRQ